MFKIPTEDRNKMADTTELVEAENYLSSLRPCPLVVPASLMFLTKSTSGFFFKGHTLI